MQGKHTNKKNLSDDWKASLFGISFTVAGVILLFMEIFEHDAIMRLGYFVFAVASILVGAGVIFQDVMLPAMEKRLRRRIESENRLNELRAEKGLSSAKHMR